MIPRYEPANGGTWNERKRLIRFRRQREHLRFTEEIKLVPRGLVTGTLAVLAALIVLVLVLCGNDVPVRWNIVDDLRMDRALVVIGLVGVATAIPLAAII